MKLQILTIAYENEQMTGLNKNLNHIHNTLSYF